MIYIENVIGQIKWFFYKSISSIFRHPRANAASFVELFINVYGIRLATLYGIRIG